MFLILQEANNSRSCFSSPCVNFNLRGGNKGLTFRLAAVQLQRWERQGGRHRWRQVLPWWWRKTRFNTNGYIFTNISPRIVIVPIQDSLLLKLTDTDSRGWVRQPTGRLNLDEPIVQGWRRYRLLWVGIRRRWAFSVSKIYSDKRPFDWREYKLRSTTEPPSRGSMRWLQMRGSSFKPLHMVPINTGKSSTLANKYMTKPAPRPLTVHLHDPPLHHTFTVCFASQGI